RQNRTTGSTLPDRQRLPSSFHAPPVVTLFELSRVFFARDFSGKAMMTGLRRGMSRARVARGEKFASRPVSGRDVPRTFRRGPGGGGFPPAGPALRAVRDVPPRFCPAAPKARLRGLGPGAALVKNDVYPRGRNAWDWTMFESFFRPLLQSLAWVLNSNLARGGPAGPGSHPNWS